MPSHTLAHLVKAKYPGVYDDMDDTDLEERILSKYPGAYDDLPRTKASEKSTVRPIPPDAKPGIGQRVGDFMTGAAKGYGESMAQTMRPLMGPVGLVTPSQVTQALTPTDAEKPGYYTEGVAEMLLPGAGMARAAKAAAPGLLRRTAKAAATPIGGGAITAAGVLAAGGSIGESLAAGGGVAAGLRKPSTAAKAVTSKAARPALKKVAEKATQGAAKAVERAAPAVEKAAPVVAKATSRGAEAASKHNTLMQFAKKIAQTNPKVGEKIWILLDEAGRPVRMLTSDQAGAAVRKGLQTTWVKNLWGR